ncbi:MAG: hypothetical protein U9N33_03895 [Campylobacterota bacterium]|nr:hypothetical protein [Campylobacterota bacterium]
MVSSSSISNGVLVLNIDEYELQHDENFAIECLKLIGKYSLYHMVLNLDKFKTVQKDDIFKLEKLIKLLSVNNIKSMVCGIDINSIVVLLHFVEDFNFDSTLDVQRAVDEIKSKN